MEVLWYTAILAPLLRDEGKLVTVSPEDIFFEEEARAGLTEHQATWGVVEYREVDAKAADMPSMGESESVDAVLTFRNVHNMEIGGTSSIWFKMIFDVLKPGGVLGVVDHRAPEGSPAASNIKSGYLAEEHVIDLAQQAGFELQAKSELNANAKDTHDHPKGVWTLPPVLRLGDTDREKYEAIGESDRMTLRFIKPVLERAE